jgi:hypothetical protein
MSAKRGTPGATPRCAGDAGRGMGTPTLSARVPDPIAAIKYHMDQNGLQPRDLIPFIGSRNRVHEVLNRRRSLTLNMIRRLHEGLGSPPPLIPGERADDYKRLLAGVTDEIKPADIMETIWTREFVDLQWEIHPLSSDQGGPYHASI